MWFSEGSNEQKTSWRRGGEPCFIKSGRRRQNASFRLDCDHVGSNKEKYIKRGKRIPYHNKICRLKDVPRAFHGYRHRTKAYFHPLTGQIDYLVSGLETRSPGLFCGSRGIRKNIKPIKKKHAKTRADRTESAQARRHFSEVEKRLRSVKLQAGKARNYLQYTTETQRAQVNFFFACRVWQNIWVVLKRRKTYRTNQWAVRASCLSSSHKATLW